MVEMGALPVIAAMGYAVAGGKGLRGFLARESARIYEVPQEAAIWPAAAIEALHAYSLVHDDLPCMDDDDLRRGQPTVHRKWNEAIAVLSGDALQALAFELVARPDVGDAEIRAELAYSLARAAGGRGMVRGQALDMAAETADAPLDLAAITELQSGKTGALITWSATVGARMAKADLTPLQTYGDAIGLAFQIADDVLDVEGDAATVGKAVGKDQEAGKATFVSLLGLEGAKNRAKSLVEEGCDALAAFGDSAESLKRAARFVIARKN
ncbi:polyprenyl synthetase family protein [Pelagovum sp. HNIBRBA483]|uniref:polyprenyl synthetase family protein n=1 Tax=Pelagovum sp. HNIBRBA483 TaxID=3233341 RepID=UPI0034A531AB